MSRFHIGSLMIGVAVAAGEAFVIRSFFATEEVGSNGLFLTLLFLFVLVTSLFSPFLAVGLSRWARGQRRASAWAFAIAATLTNGWGAIWCVATPYFGLLSLLAMILSVLCGLSVVLGLGVYWASGTTRHDVFPIRPSLAAWMLALALAFMPLSMALTFWPLRLAILVSRPAMDRVADQIAGGAVIRGTKQVGFFRVDGGVVDPTTRSVGLITEPNPSGRSGFVRLGPGAPAHHMGPFFNLNLDVDLGGGWRYQEED